MENDIKKAKEKLDDSQLDDVAGGSFLGDLLHRGKRGRISTLECRGSVGVISTLEQRGYVSSGTGYKKSGWHGGWRKRNSFNSNGSGNSGSGPVEL